MAEIDPMIPSQFASEEPEPEAGRSEHPTEEQGQKQQKQQPAKDATILHHNALLEQQQLIMNSLEDNSIDCHKRQRHHDNHIACHKHHYLFTSDTTDDTTDDTKNITTATPTATPTPTDATQAKAPLSRLTHLILAHPVLASFLAAQVLCSGIPVCLFLGGVLVAAFIAGAVFAGFAMLVMGPVLLGTGCLGVGVWGFGWAVVVLGRVVGRVLRGESVEVFGLGVWSGAEGDQGEGKQGGGGREG
ncbi:hypothetical protein ASPACDRAFT_48052 [Aspergillus aculeatus ATCC 16872]|uniref:Uncharacterized protein n=1 Tax=Aspergillus aculeatus (strain ATCC 16872 / CBS 172.66 / WB 5094) TaxID=690307 RepID=A0A1L9WGN2_ASPA1|nr:uncharacterized protein ASPACDRAFT_48052 [Aspergillus aculeatus ATCC 16872]OJJ95303.1 hypothetical protein ASPACDRAFT_48052 [Aspergillus aculeatus ATCC 16872]